MSRNNQDRDSRNTAEPYEHGSERGETEQNQPHMTSTPRFTSWLEPSDVDDEQVDELYSYARVVARYPVTSLVASFSVGFGLGVLAVAVLPRNEESWLERQRFPRSLHDLSSSLRRIPSMVAEHLPEAPGRR
jgi:hypothetical protein